MLRLKLVKKVQDEMVYNYFPEQKEEYGTVSISEDTGEMKIRKISPNDAHRRYLFHAVNRIEDYLAEKSFPESDVVAWH